MLSPGRKALSNNSPFTLFEHISPRADIAWRWIFSSAVLHCLALLAVLHISAWLGEVEREIHPSPLASRPLVIRMPERLHFQAPIVRKPKAEPAAQSGIADGGSSQRKLTAPPSSRRDSPGPPDVPRVAADFTAIMRSPTPKATQTLVQPRIPELRAQPIPLPSFMLWSAAPPKPALEVIPRSAETPPVQPPRSERPSLAVPNQERAPAPHAIATAVEPRPSPLKLPAANATPVPASRTEPAVPGTASIVDRANGEPVNVLSLSPRPVSIQPMLSVPALNQFAAKSGLEEKPGSPPAGRGTEAGSAGGGKGKAGLPGGGAGPGIGPAGEGTGEGSSGASQPALTSVTPSPKAPESIIPGGETVRMKHPPNGIFDVVIVQTSAQNGIPMAEKLLTGRPIYTVYLQVGDWKEWILQYCVPNSSSSAHMLSSSVVSLDSPAPVEAPYPLLTVRPKTGISAKGKYILVHGTVNAQGRPVGFRTAQTEDAGVAETIVGAIEQWEFRPAAQQGHAIPVEVVFAIPSRPL